MFLLYRNYQIYLESIWFNLARTRKGPGGGPEGPGKTVQLYRQSPIYSEWLNLV